MKTYKITGLTNSWIAQRDGQFRGRTSITIEEGLSLKEAQRTLLQMLNDCYDSNWINWGLACIHNDNAGSRLDGTRYFEYDSRYFSIEEEEEEEVED